MAVRRIDLHCHSDASNKTSEAILNAIHCPESYSAPHEVYDQAKRRGMDFVAITDHDTIDGVLQIADRADVLIGEELTCWFPEDHCKMHVLVYGIDSPTHDALQARAKNIYDVADHIEQHNIAHAVAHPIYRQNDKLERWHLERLLLLFKGFECLNGAHSALHREAFEPLLDRINAAEISRLSETHALRPHWNTPWIKARTGGSDDHGLLNVGKTWTEFPEESKSPGDILRCLREGNCKPGGEAGSSAKLAHTFYSVAVRYYSRHIMAPGAKPNLATTILQTLAGVKPAPSKGQLARLAIRNKVKKIGNAIASPFARRKSSDQASPGTGIIKGLFLDSAKSHLPEQHDLFAAAERGLPPLGEYAQMFDFVRKIDRDVTQGIAAAIRKSIEDASFTRLFDSIAAILAQQFVLSPYYFAVFHQNKERQLLRQITNQPATKDSQTLRIGLFTDTLDEVNGVGRFIRDIGAAAKRANRQLEIHTCNQVAIAGEALRRRNFVPLLSGPLPFYGELKLNLPPVLEILEWADRRQFDVIHCSTPGPMGLCGWLVGRMLRVPMLATYHTDFPAYLEKLTGDHRVVNGASAYMKWFYSQASTVLTRSSAYRFKLIDLGICESKLRVMPAGVNTEMFNSNRFSSMNSTRAQARTPSARLRRLLYVGRVSVEKNLPMLAQIFKMLCQNRDDLVLTIAGDGPYLATIKKELAKLPAEFVGVLDDQHLSALYAGSDLFIFPSRTDTLGQVVMEAQACGLPAIVSSEGGPKESVVDDVTGRVIASSEPSDWCKAIEELLSDEPRRLRYAQAAAQRATRFSLSKTFESFWAEHLAAVDPRASTQTHEPPVVVSVADFDRRASKQPASL